LFGHKKGAFTGAIPDHPGILAAADGGTVFLDEVDSLSLDVQAKLLLFLDSYEVRRVGDVASRRIDVQLIFASNADLKAKVISNELRSDFYHRIAAADVTLPTLDSIKHKLPCVVRVLSSKISENTGIPLPHYDESALNALVRYPWNGNIRELIHVLTRVMIDASGAVVTESMLEDYLQFCPVQKDSPGFTVHGLPTLAEVESYYIQHVLDQVSNHNLSHISELLGISRKTLYRKRQQIDEQEHSLPVYL